MNYRRNDIVEVSLQGGPERLPLSLRTQRVAADDLRVKIEFYGRYEHFERLTVESPGVPPVFQWTGTTRIAE
ncbi:hypothetical protein GCM10023322_48290 [Rugosimonospora acidiphila]|uniref:Uncharacterized protein n=1 Tax=Rugosimonospora acidiphila TaxID=556531 RepID=A0ABP9S4I1_9ACTN